MFSGFKSPCRKPCVWSSATRAGPEQAGKDLVVIGVPRGLEDVGAVHVLLEKENGLGVAAELEDARDIVMANRLKVANSFLSERHLLAKALTGTFFRTPRTPGGRVGGQKGFPIPPFAEGTVDLKIAATSFP
jgi:hypothetical protein